MYVRRFAAIAAVSLLSSCAIHPLPEDVTGVDTAGIVKQIRCEARDAARKIILRELERLATYGDNTTAQNLLSQYTANPELMSDFNRIVHSLDLTIFSCETSSTWSTPVPLRILLI